MTSTPITGHPTVLASTQRTGVALAALLGVVDIVSLGFPTPDGDEGPPIGIVVLGGVLGLVTLAFAVKAWRTGDRTAIRVIVATRVLSMLSAVPAFFVDIPVGIKVVVAVSMVVTAVAVTLMLRKDGPAPV